MYSCSLRVLNERQIVAQFGGFFHRSYLRREQFAFAPDAGEDSLNFLFEARDQLVVGGDEGLLCFDLGDDSLLGGDGREGDCTLVNSCLRDGGLATNLRELVEIKLHKCLRQGDQGAGVRQLGKVGLVLRAQISDGAEQEPHRRVVALRGHD